MINKQSITIKLYTIADEKGYKADDFETDFAERYIDKTKPENPDAVRHAFLAPTYHQLIDWVFDEANFSKQVELRTTKENIEWLEFWYNHLKDCPLKGELIYRLKKWFRLQEIYYNIPECIGEFRIDINILPEMLGGYKTYKEAEHAAIIEVFKLLKK